MEQSLGLTFEILEEQGIAVVRCRGRLTFGKEAQLLKRCVESVLSQFSICVLNLKGVDQIDARGLGAVVACFDKARAIGALLLVGGASATVQELFQITRLNDVLEVYRSESEALQACTQAA
jgi:anti-anti-sigma factor